MRSAQDFINNKLRAAEVDGWVVSGASKRGTESSALVMTLTAVLSHITTRITIALGSTLQTTSSPHEKTVTVIVLVAQFRCLASAPSMQIGLLP